MIGCGVCGRYTCDRMCVWGVHVCMDVVCVGGTRVYGCGVCGRYTCDWMCVWEGGTCVWMWCVWEEVMCVDVVWGERIG